MLEDESFRLPNSKFCPLIVIPSVSRIMLDIKSQEDQNVQWIRGNMQSWWHPWLFLMHTEKNIKNATGEEHKDATGVDIKAAGACSREVGEPKGKYH